MKDMNRKTKMIHVVLCSMLFLLLHHSYSSAETTMRSRVLPSSSAPVLFEENIGQFGGDARFRVRMSGHTLWLTDDAFWITVFEPYEAEDASDSLRWPVSSGRNARASAGGVRLKLSFPGANPACVVEPLERLSTKISYFIDEKTRCSDVPVVNGVRYVDLFPGIDLEIRGRGESLTPCFVVKEPSSERTAASPAKILLKIEGGRRTAASGGTLSIDTDAGSVRFPLFRIAGTNAASVVEVSSPRIVGNEVFSPFDSGKPLLSPAGTVSEEEGVLLYGSYLGGALNDFVHGVAAGDDEVLYIVGSTKSENFPVKPEPGAFQEDPLGSTNGFVSKVDSRSGVLLFSTYLGGGDRYANTECKAVVPGGSGGVYVAGTTDSSVFPLPEGKAVYQREKGGEKDVFVAHITAEGTHLESATYLGGSGYEYCSGMVSASSASSLNTAKASSEYIYVAGTTRSGNFPLAGVPFQNTLHGPEDGFVAKLSVDLSTLAYGSYFGGSSYDQCYAITADIHGNAYFTGTTQSQNDFPVTGGAFQTEYGGGDYDAFAAKLATETGVLSYCTYLGGARDGSKYGRDYGYAIAVDSSGNAYIAGTTSSSNFPVSDKAYQKTLNAQYTNGFVTKFNESGSGLLYSTFFGGENQDEIYSLYLGAGQTAVIAGYTMSVNFPATENAFQKTLNGTRDGFAAQLDATGENVLYSSFFGGSNKEYITACGSKSSEYVFVGGYTDSTNIPVTDNAFQKTHASPGDQDGFIAKISLPSVPVSAGAWVIAGDEDYLYRYDEAESGTSVQSQWTFVGAKAGVVAGMSKDVCWIGEKNNEYLYSRNADGSWTWHAPQIRSASPYGENAVWIVEKNSEFVFRYQGGVWTWNAARAKQVSAVSGDVLWLIERDSGNVYRHTVSTNAWEWTPVKGLSLSAASSDVVWVVKLEDNRLYRYDHGTKVWEWQPVEAVSVSAISESEAYYVGTDGALYHFDTTTGTKTKILDSCGGVSSYPPAALSEASGGAAASSAEGSGGSGCTAASLSPLALLLLLPLGALLRR